MNPRERHWLALSLVDGVGSRTAELLLERFGSLDALFAAEPAAIVRATGLAPELAERIARAPRTDALRIEQRLVEAHGVHVLPFVAEDFPARLRGISGAPMLLYCRGESPVPPGPALAIVGTRSYTRYGEKATRRLIEELAALEPRLVVVSGLARGIDTVAHEQALACGLKTVAVMAGGLSEIYPPENEGLAERIAAQGGLVTEFSMARKPRARQFPVRNRVVSGLAGGVLVVEAGERSGALITAGFAQTQGRALFAVPGNIDAPHSAGTNHLIATGQARLTTSGAAVLEALADARRPAPEQLDWLAEQRQAAGARVTPEGDKGRVLASLAKGPLHPDDLSGEVAIPIERLIGLLLELELSGEIVQTADNQYALA